MALLRVRRFEPSDADTLWHLFYDTVHSVNCRDYSPEALDAWAPASFDAERWKASFQRRTTFVAEKAGRIAGFAELEDSGKSIGRFYVSKDHQRRGVGLKLYEALEEEAKRQGVAELTVEASITARPFFERMGFGNARRQTVERRGVTLTNFVMEKSLNQ